MSRSGPWRFNDGCGIKFLPIGARIFLHEHADPHAEPQPLAPGMPDTEIMTGPFSGTARQRESGSGGPTFQSGYPAHAPFPGKGRAGACALPSLASGEPLPLAPGRWRARDILAVLLIALVSLAIADCFGQMDLLW